MFHLDCNHNEPYSRICQDIACIAVYLAQSSSTYNSFSTKVAISKSDQALNMLLHKDCRASEKNREHDDAGYDNERRSKQVARAMARLLFFSNKNLLFSITA